MKLLREEAVDINFLEESQTDGKHLYISGIFLQGGIKNRNGRIYPPPLLDREANRYVTEQVNRKSAYGELGHPANPSLNADRISHRITELSKDGNNWMGKAVVIPEGHGLVVKGIIETGGNVGVSSRGLGTLKEDKKLGANIVQDDFRLMVGADIVMNPSAPDAWMTAIHENCEWVFDAAKGEWRIQEQIADIKKQLKNDPDQVLGLFERYMRLLSKR